MAGKDDKKKRQPPAELRYGKRTVEEIEELVREVKLMVRRLDGSIEAARRMSVVELTLDGVTKGQRALQLLKGFAANVEHAVRKAEYGVG